MGDFVRIKFTDKIKPNSAGERWLTEKERQLDREVADMVKGELIEHFVKEITKKIEKDKLL